MSNNIDYKNFEQKKLSISNKITIEEKYKELDNNDLKVLNLKYIYTDNENNMLRKFDRFNFVIDNTDFIIKQYNIKCIKDMIFSNIERYKFKIDITGNKKLLDFLKNLDELIYLKGKKEFGENIKFKPSIKKSKSEENIIDYLKKYPDKTAREILNEFKEYYNIEIEVNGDFFDVENLSNLDQSNIKIIINPQCYFRKSTNKLKILHKIIIMNINDKENFGVNINKYFNVY